MPGMMDTVLDLGINENVVRSIASRSGSQRFALDLYRRFIHMFGKVVLGIDGALFDTVMDRQLKDSGVRHSGDLGADDMRDVVEYFKHIVAKAADRPVPEDPWDQLTLAILGVFDSWHGRRAAEYRRYHGIPDALGTAVSVVSMVYGNMDESSCTGVMFTRDPSTGRNALYGEYLANAQGEDVVAGGTTPNDLEQLAVDMPRVYDQLRGVASKLEAHYRDAQDVEFTVEQGRLYILQTRTAKRSAKAAATMAVEMARAGLVSKNEALMRVDSGQFHQLLLPGLREAAMEEARGLGRLLATGSGTAPGGATGTVVLDPDRAEALAKQGVSVILARPETTAEDIHGMLASSGILTSRGGSTSHAAVVARGLGKPCVIGAEAVEVNTEDRLLRCGSVTVAEGELISIDGSTGEVFLGEVETIAPSILDHGDVATLLGWADDVRSLGVWANADTAEDARTALNFGAEGIGLCRTEHMFFEPERLSLVQEMILAAHVSAKRPDDAGLREDYLDVLEKIMEIQVRDFEDLFGVMEGRPTVIRLLDPPLHEFLPNYKALLTQVMELRSNGHDRSQLAEKEETLAAVEELREANPMLGLRGARLGLMYPEIYETQVRAIVTAASNAVRRGESARPQIMLPLVSDARERARLRERLQRTINDTEYQTGVSVRCEIGAMIEVPRAALTTAAIAQSADFFSFGTNDLTQTTYGFSRDDAEGKFLARYLEDGILPLDPFQQLDTQGVGWLVARGCELGRSVRPDLKIGICGEHGGDPASIQFFHETGLDYVSCSPYRVPVARLAAAQAAIRAGARSHRSARTNGAAVARPLASPVAAGD